MPGPGEYSSEHSGQSRLMPRSNRLREQHGQHRDARSEREHARPKQMTCTQASSGAMIKKPRPMIEASGVTVARQVRNPMTRRCSNNMASRTAAASAAILDHSPVGVSVPAAVMTCWAIALARWNVRGCSPAVFRSKSQSARHACSQTPRRPHAEKTARPPARPCRRGDRCR